MYPVPLTWSNCPGVGGADAIAYDWQNVLLNPVSSACTTLIKLNGNGNSNLTVRYYAN